MFYNKTQNVIQRELFRKDIQVLRGIAVLSVLLFHFKSKSFQNGYLGVDVFFVISGYLISNIIYSELSEKKFKLSDFFLRRIRRIIPSLISLLIFVNLLSFFVLDQEKVISTLTNSIYALFFVSNVAFARLSNYFDGEIEFNPIINLWSLSIEEQFYIIFPILIILMFKFKLKRHLLILVFLSIFSYFTKSQIFFESINLLNTIFFSFKSYLFYSPTTRVFEFLVGVIAMLIRFVYKFDTNQISSLFRNLIFFGLIVLMFFNFYINVNLALVIALFLTFILLISTKDEGERDFGDIAVLQKIGLISYSLYLFHQPILASIKNHNLNTTPYGNFHINLDNLLIVSLVFIVIFLISYLNFYLIENKFRNKKYFRSNYKTFFPVSTLILLLVGISIHSTSGYDFRFQKNSYPETFRNYEVKFGTNYISENNNMCINRDYIEATCKFGIGEDKKNIYLIGNSQISSITTGFLKNKYKDKYSITEYTRQGCSLREGVCDYYEGSLKYKELYEIKNSLFIFDSYDELNLIDFDLESKNNLLIIKSTEMTSLEINDKLLQLRKTVDRLTEKNNKVIILEPIPRPFLNTKMFEFVNNNTLNLEYESWLNYKKNATIIYEQIQNKNFYTISLDDVFCTKISCSFTSDEVYYYIDDAHPSFYGANLIGDKIFNFIESFD